MSEPDGTPFICLYNQIFPSVSISSSDWQVVNQKEKGNTAATMATPRHAPKQVFVKPGRRPLSARKLDILYLAFFVIHVPVMLCKCGIFDQEDCLPPSYSTVMQLLLFPFVSPSFLSLRRC
jgi:hypothetical protein